MRSDTARVYHERMLEVLVQLQRNLDEAPDLASLARIAHFSPYHFHRIFRGMVGEPLHEHVRRLRLERAARQLKQGRASVTRIALDAGFEAHEAFTRAFRRQFGTSPTAYRKGEGARRGPGVHASAARKLRARREGGVSMDVRIEDVKPRRVAFVRHTGPYAEVGETWTKLMSWAWPRGLVGPGTACLGICHDDPEVTAAGKVRYDACITVDERFRPEGEVGVQEVAGGAYAVVTHRGPYDRLTATYARLYGEWLPTHGREPADKPPFEVYRNSPRDTKPEDLVTDLYVPLA